MAEPSAGALPFICEGGLVANNSTFIMQPGQALQLENFEPDIEGGYKRIQGFHKHIHQEVPSSGPSASNEPLLCVTTFADRVIAARADKIFNSASTLLGSAKEATIEATDTMAGEGVIIVQSTEGFKHATTDDPVKIQIGSERFEYTGKTATTFTGVTRAIDSTTAILHKHSIFNRDTVVSQDWTELISGQDTKGKYNTERFNFNGTDKIMFVNGVDDPIVFNLEEGQTAGQGNGIFSLVHKKVSYDVAVKEQIDGQEVLVHPAVAIKGAQQIAVFKNHVFLADFTDNRQKIIFGSILKEDEFKTTTGAGELTVDDAVVGLKVFRENLFIFCETRIFKLSGSSSSDFALSPVTRDIGCINGHTIQEFAGDLIFLGPDGLRTVAGTARIGDVELGTISANVQSIFDENIKNSKDFDSVVIPNKTQYRLFFSKATETELATNGIVCVLKKQSSGTQGFEFSSLKGIKPSCTDTFVTTGDVIVLHGGFDGFVYRQEKTNSFDGTAIQGKYRSPDMTMGDPGVRKNMQRVLVNYKPDGELKANLFLRYDYESKDSVRPNSYALDSTDVAGIYNNLTSRYGIPTYGGPSQPIVRQPVEGSGFAVALRVNDSGITPSYSLKGFQLEFQLGERR